MAKKEVTVEHEDNAFVVKRGDEVVARLASREQAEEHARELRGESEQPEDKS